MSKEADSLRQQLAAMTAERDKAKAIPMRYRRMEFNAQLQNENESLRQQLAHSRKQVTVLRYALEEVKLRAISLADAQATALEALTATADLGGLILCHAEPVAEVKRHTGSLKDMAIIVWSGEQPAEGTQLYLAWEPKP